MSKNSHKFIQKLIEFRGRRLNFNHFKAHNFAYYQRLEILVHVKMCAYNSSLQRNGKDGLFIWETHNIMYAPDTRLEQKK